MTTKKLPEGTVLLTGNQVAAAAAMLARADMISAYPITPQTVVVEDLAEYSAGRENIIFKNVNNEHAMLGYAIAASHCGVRVFTASSSQGILYGDEQLHRAGRERVPLVMAVANRSLAVPWNLEADYNDTMSKRDCGWMQFYCSTHQEILDTILLAYRAAEQVLLPAMVSYEGFILSHTSMPLTIPPEERVDAFLPPFAPPEEWVLDPARPRAFSQAASSTVYFHLQKEVERAMKKALLLIEGGADDFSRVFGRTKVGLLETAGNPEAPTVLVTIGTIGETAKLLLESMNDLFLIRIHTFRPFPRQALQTALQKAYRARIVVIDRALSFGGMPPLASEVTATEHYNRVFSFVAGIGGVNVTEKTLVTAIEISKKASPFRDPSVCWLLNEREWEKYHG